MIAIEPILVAFLANCPPVVQLIGDERGVRLFPNVAPQGASYPRATYYRVSTQRRRHYKGTVGVKPTVEFDCWALDYPSAKAVALAIGGSLNDFIGNVPGGRVRVQGTFLDDERDDYEPPENGGEAGVHKVALTVIVGYCGR